MCLGNSIFVNINIIWPTCVLSLSFSISHSSLTTVFGVEANCNELKVIYTVACVITDLEEQNKCTMKPPAAFQLNRKHIPMEMNANKGETTKMPGWHSHNSKGVGFGHSARGIERPILQG